MTQPETRAKKVTIRPLPKIIFLYPTWIAALICAILASTMGEPVGSGASSEAPQAAATAEAGTESAPEVEDSRGKLCPTWAAGAFMIVFLVNMLIFSFEFGRTRSLMVIFALLALLLGLHTLGYLGPLGDFIRSIHPLANDHFFWTLALFLGGLYVLILINTRFNYYEIGGNSIIHYTGFMGSAKRYPTPNLRRSMEITDVFEHLLLGSGQYIFYPAGEREAIVVDAVPFINKKEKDLLYLISTIQMADVD